MRPRDRGVIVQVGSSLACRAIPLQAAYCASKFAIRGFTDALHVELRHDNSKVRITMVQMPGLNTPQFRPDYLDAPLPGDRGARGRFGDEAKPRSLQLALTKRKRPLLAAGALAVALLAAGAGSASAEIIPQQSIAGVSVDMTEQDVVGVLGEPGKVHTRYGGPSGEDFFTTYRYGKRGVKVRFLRKRAGNRVTGIEVYKGRQELTATGIGLKSHRDQVKAGVAGSKCKRYDKWYAICTVGRGEIGDIQTTFWLNQRDKVKLVTLGRILYH